jgi:hypothetical protein
MGKEVVETIHGKYHKYEIIKDTGGVFGSIKFNIYRDGSYYKGPYSSLADAVEKARKEG